MKELICPNCHTTFQVDESVYATILAQVRGKEFNEEVSRRLEEMKQQFEVREKAAMMETERQYDRKLAAKDLQLADARSEISSLKNMISSFDVIKQTEITKVESEKDRRYFEAVTEKERTIADLASKLELEKLAAARQEIELREQHKAVMKAKDEEIDRLRDMKSRLSTKMIGETLEQHCLNTFNLARSMGSFQSAYFGKDNDASEGSKGDFIFRDYIDGVECVSIMFEMKNEDDRTATKHRNEDFFAKLHKDRVAKNCEYAVLVSTLEADNELYNSGIVDVSYRYEKMYVIRPQFFLPLISLLSQSSKREARTVIALRRELSAARAQSIDVTRFEERRDKFTAEFMKFVSAHQQKHAEAITAIDKAIDDARKQIEKLEKIKKLFDTSNQKLIRAGEVIEHDFTIKKLTHGNPTMRAKFEEARRSSPHSLPPSEDE